MPTAAAIEEWLSSLSDADLDSVLVDWQVPHDIASLSAAAKWMSEPASIDSMLSRTTAADLSALRAGTATATLTARGLTPDPTLASRIPADIEVPTTRQSQPDATTAADQAATAVTRLSGVVASLADKSVQLSGRGIPLAAELRFRAREVGVGEELWQRLVATAVHYRFAAKLEKQLCVSDIGAAWLALDFADRWQSLRDRFLGELTLSQRAFLRSGIPAANGALPLASADTAGEFDRVLARAKALGIGVGGSEVTAEQIASRVPEPIDYVYLQPDQTLVAPGPLTRAAETEIAEMAVSEARGTASTWRLTPASLHGAMARGRSADELLERLGRLSATGVPQPVAYLVRDAERRFGSVRVSAGAPTTVETDHDTAKQLIVDRSLLDLELRVPTGSALGDGRLHAAAPAQVVLDRLLEERYPALLVDDRGRPIVGEPEVVRLAEAAPLSSLTERLLGRSVSVSAMQPDWLHEQLMSAVKTKAPVRVTVVSGTQTHHATLVPLAVSNGRLRGRDIERDLERTLPLRAITEVAGLKTA